jgi:putative Holliday junction resolvase
MRAERRTVAPDMAICNPTDLKALLRKGDRLLGLDVGTKTVGMALSDTTRMIATPLETIRRTKFRDDVKRLVDAIERHGVGGIVVGLPIALDGSEGPRAQGVRQVAKNLLEHIDRPLVFWDERLSTAAVERGMIAADMTRKRRAEIIDRVAAAYILQGFLDRLARMPAPP